MDNKDVNFPSSVDEVSVSNFLTTPEILAIRLRYLGYAYSAMARFSRGSVLIQDVKIITKEMVDQFLSRKI